MVAEEAEEEEEANEEIPDIVGPHLLVRVDDNDVSHVRIEKAYCAVRESGMDDEYTVVSSSIPDLSSAGMFNRSAHNPCFCPSGAGVSALLSSHDCGAR